MRVVISLVAVLSASCTSEMGVITAEDGTEIRLASGTAGSMDFYVGQPSYSLFLSSKNETWDCDGLDPTFRDPSFQDAFPARTGYLLVASLEDSEECQVMRWDRDGPFGGVSGGTEYIGECTVRWSGDGDRITGSLTTEGALTGEVDFDVPDCGRRGFRHWGPV